MKKLTTKLSLNATTVASLDNQELAAVKGGFTYSASTGDMCSTSQSLTATSAWACGILMELESQPGGIYHP